MKIDPRIPSLSGIQGITPPSESKPAASSGFDTMFADAIKEVDKMQKDANNQIEGLLTGAEGVTTHSAMIALEKADIAFNLMTQLKSRIVRAYEEVMRTQV